MGLEEAVEQKKAIGKHGQRVPLATLTELGLPTRTQTGLHGAIIDPKATDEEVDAVLDGLRERARQGDAEPS